MYESGVKWFELEMHTWRSHFVEVVCGSMGFSLRKRGYSEKIRSEDGAHGDLRSKQKKGCLQSFLRRDERGTRKIVVT